MLKTKLKDFISNQQEIILCKEEIAYANIHQMIEDENKIIEKNDASLFSNAYIERSNKETEELEGVESINFLNQPIDYLRKHKQEFIYIDSNRFNIIGMDSFCMEVDDVFGTYEAMLGLKLQKKHEKTIKNFLATELKGDTKFSLLFSQGDGLWDVNFAINGVEGFNENISIGEACKLVYLFLFKLVRTVEENR